MMRFLTVGFIFCQIIVQLQAGKFAPHKSQNAKNHEILETAESRYNSNYDHSDRDYPNYNNRIVRKDYDLPITFKAPHYEAQDFWRNKHDYYNRRTFLEGFSPDPHDKTSPFPGLYQFMSSIFGGREETPSEYSEAYYNRGRPTPSYTYVPPPYSYGPTEPNYIPPPKPIRASVIKLETITRSPPVYPSFEYEPTTKYYPHVGTILNHVLIENSKAQQSFHPPESIEKIPSFKPLPVLPRPGYVPPTTLKPYPGFLNHRTFKHHNDSDYKYPESVQDQLPPIPPEEVEIPYESEKPIPQIFPTETLPERGFAYTEEFFPPSVSRATTNILGLIDIRSLNSPVGRRGRPNGMKLDFDTTTVKSFPGAVEKIKRPTFKKKLTAQLDKNPVERVTNLTVLGYSKVGNANVHNPVNYLKVKELIDYEMAKLGNTSDQNSSSRTVNLNDELSLDAKILKDTNWDGLAVPTTAITTELIKETTTFPAVVRIEPRKPNKTAFWEIQTTLAPTESDFTDTTTATEQTRTTTYWPLTETSELATTEETTTRRIPAVRRLENLEREPFRSITDDSEVTVPPERTTFKRRYSRRPKVVSFTPYPSPEDVQRKLVNRNHFPKRQKPNITLTFGNKNVLKNRQSLGKDEVMKFSDEDVRKRRKIGKRRQVYKRIRVSTSERPVQDDSL